LFLDDDPPPDGRRFHLAHRGACRRTL